MPATFPRERDFQAAVIATAKLGGWLSFHPFSSRRSTPGFPDLTLVHPVTGRLLFCELKTTRGRLRPEQETWLAALGIKHTAVVWRPCDWDSGEVQRVLLAERQGRAA